MNACWTAFLFLWMSTLAVAPPAPQAARADDPIYQGKPVSQWASEALSPNVFIRWRAASVLDEMEGIELGELTGLNKALAIWTAALKDKDLGVRERADDILYHFGRGPQAEAKVASLIKKLKVKDVNERRDAASRLFDLHPASRVAVPALRAALKDANGDVRRAAAVTLGFMGAEGKAAVPVLIQVLKSEPDALHFYYSDAAAALAAIGPGAKAAVPELARLLREEKFEHIRVAMAWSLGRIGPEAREAVGVLRKALHGSEWEVRVHAAIALWRIRHDPTEPLAVLLAAMKERPAALEHSIWIGAILESLGKMGPQAKDAVPLIRPLRRSRQRRVRWYATQMLKKIDPAAIRARAAAPPTAKRNELRGRWSVLVWDANGFWMTGDERDDGIGELYRNIVVVFTDDRVVLKPKGRAAWYFLGMTFVWEGSYQVNPAREPKEIDVTIMAWGSDGKGELTDKVIRGIYALRGNKLTICIDHSDKSRRPDAFKTAPKRSHILMLLEREKK
jgi:uncharacterized protein (TIGR03067 family)